MYGDVKKRDQRDIKRFEDRRYTAFGYRPPENDIVQIMVTDKTLARLLLRTIADKDEHDSSSSPHHAIRGPRGPVCPTR